MHDLLVRFISVYAEILNHLAAGWMVSPARMQWQYKREGQPPPALRALLLDRGHRHDGSAATRLSLLAATASSVGRTQPYAAIAGDRRERSRARLRPRHRAPAGPGRAGRAHLGRMAIAWRADRGGAPGE